MDMKTKTWLIIGSIVFAIPILLYFLNYWCNGFLGFSTNSTDWTAFGGMWFGFALVAFTAFNIWLMEKKADEAHEAQKNLRKSESLIRIKNDVSEIVSRLESIFEGEIYEYATILNELEDRAIFEINLFEKKEVFNLLRIIIIELNRIVIFYKRNLYGGPFGPTLSFNYYIEHQYITEDDRNYLIERISCVERQTRLLIEAMEEEIHDKFHS